ncbi:phasin family protein [Noviherbaspirillum sp.]|uniref:phasin family protein n=1 Tax=Noviherbaspirillum sp. TaxID=1926288 RepID=UPI002B492686|nr:phasin family protein [Noviherbaspirillum sp.]HJV83376.1 phasin family protein [Noviherbaspirillum sp.]
MQSFQEQLSRATQAKIETGGLLVDKAMDGMKKMTDLHLNLARLALDQANFAARKLATLKDARQLAALSATQMESDARCVMDYAYYLMTIMFDTLGDFFGIIGDAFAPGAPPGHAQGRAGILNGNT